MIVEATVEFARDDPEAYIARDRRRALASQQTMPDRVTGSALFADISGFTPLTEALANELGSQRGAEELTATLGRVFHAVIDQLDRRSGDVIYFSGDAITCWLDGDDGRRATAAGLAMQDAMAQVGQITTPGGTAVQLALKVAVAVGRARRFVVGDPQIQLIDVLAGALIDDLADAEHHAMKGEVVLDQSALDSLGDLVTLSERREDPERGRSFGVVTAIVTEVQTIDVIEPPSLDEALVTPWVLPEVYDRMRAGRGELLTELRPATPVFLRFDGIDYDDDPDAIEKLDAFVRRAQSIMAGYGGNVLQLTLGDKGAYLYGVFGSPVAHEDDAARAASAALELRDLERTTDAREIQIGIAHGRLRSGTYGHAMRRTFVCLGDAVNLAARLMSAAPAGQIYVEDQVRQAAGDAFIWEKLPPLTVKGKAATIVAHALTGSLQRASRRKTRFQLDLVGRRDELARLNDGLELTAAGDGRIIGVSADAGMGKSRLIAEFVRIVRRRGLFVAFGECQSFGTNTSYFVWREIWRRLLHLSDDDPDEAQAAQIRATLEAIDPVLAERAPLLGGVVGLEMADTPLTAAMDAKLRKGSLEDLLAAVLRARVADEPVILVLEDCHWIDPLSRDLLEVLGRTMANLPVLIVLAYRPASEPGGALGVETIPDFDEIRLDELTGEDALGLIRLKLEQVSPDSAGAEVPVDLATLLLDRSGGNPFYVEELISYIVAQGVDPTDSAALHRLELPTSLHSLVLSRIDSMHDGPRRTLKIASVVGRVFEAPVLPGAYPELGTLDQVLEHLAELRMADLVSLDRELDHAYLFKHVATQEVAYESLPFALRSRLHGLIGSYLERIDPDGIDRRLDLLAHHFWLSDDDERKRTYLGRAADAARTAYANASAIDYLERLIPLLHGAPAVDARLKLAKILELTGDWPRAEAVAREALSGAVDASDQVREAWSRTALAEVARKQGQYEAANAELAQAGTIFSDAQDEAGLGEVWHLSGTIAAQQGDLDWARKRYEESLEIRERIGDRSRTAALYSNLAIVAEYDGDLAESRRMAERALAIRTELGDRWGIGVSRNNLGAIAIHEGRPDEARHEIEEAIRLMLEVGDSWFAASARVLLGNVRRDLGELSEAGAEYARSLSTFVEMNDQLALAELLEDIAHLAVRGARHAAAIRVVESAAVLRSGIGATLAPAMREELDEWLRPSVDALGPGATERARAVGRGLDAPAAVDLAERICTDPMDSEESDRDV